MRWHGESTQPPRSCGIDPAGASDSRVWKSVRMGECNARDAKYGVLSGNVIQRALDPWDLAGKCRRKVTIFRGAFWCRSKGIVCISGRLTLFQNIHIDSSCRQDLLCVQLPSRIYLYHIRCTKGPRKLITNHFLNNVRPLHQQTKTAQNSIHPGTPRRRALPHGYCSP